MGPLTLWHQQNHPQRERERPPPVHNGASSAAVSLSSAGVPNQLCPLRRQIIRNPVEQGHKTQSNPFCMKDLWPSDGQFWKIISDLETVNNPFPDSFRAQKQR